MTPADLQHFLDERHMTRRSIGAALQVSQDRLRRWLSGSQPIPRHISLACAALAYGLPEWPADLSEEMAAAEEQSLDYFNHYIAGDR